MDKHLEILGLYCGISFFVAFALHFYVWAFRAQFLKSNGVGRPYFNLSLTDSQTWRMKHESPNIVAFEIVAYVFTWYGISLSLTMFNKWFIVYFDGGFPFPLTATAFHMLIKLILSRIVIHFNGMDVPSVPSKIYWRIVVPIGVATALDVGASNIAFRYVTVTFYTILKSGALIWILFWAVLTRVESFTCRIGLIVIIIAAGLMLASFGETDFSLVGFCLVMASGCFSGLRWAFTQGLLDCEANCHDPINVIYLIAPSSAVGLIPFVLAIEAWGWFQNPFFKEGGVSIDMETLLMVVSGGVISFFLIFAEVKLVELTSALTMGVFGQVKEVLTIALSMAVFGDNLSLLNASGLVIAMVGTAWYKREKVLNNSNVKRATRQNDLEGDLEEIFNDLGLQLEDDENSDDKGT